MIEMSKKYQTRDGRAVEILRTNVKNKDFPVVGIITEKDGSETQDRWTERGGYFDDDNGEDPNTSSSGLIPVPTKHEGWAAIFENTYGFYVFLTRPEAVQYLHKGDTDGREGGHIIPVTWED